MPENRNDPAGNWVGSGNHKAGSLLVSSVPAGPDIAQEARRAESDLTFEDRHSAWLAGFEAGMNHRFGLEVEDRARGLLNTWALESRNMARQYAARVGPAWSALILECSQVDD